MNKTISAAEAERISHELSRLGYDLLALHNFSRQDLSEGDRAHLTILVETVAKVAVQKLDACITRLGGIRLGAFEDEEASEVPAVEV